MIPRGYIFNRAKGIGLTKRSFDPVRSFSGLVFRLLIPWHGWEPLQSGAGFEGYRSSPSTVQKKARADSD
jgi:hypothetical protein